MDRDSEPDLVRNARTLHEAKEKQDENMIRDLGKVVDDEVTPAKKSMNDVLAKYGLGK